MKMDNEDDSFPYIDETTDDETDNHYNVKIIEKYQNKNRNIEITNTSSNYDKNKPLSPVAPLADEDEPGNFQSEIESPVKFLPLGMKLVIKSWNSSVSIQGLDKKSSITFGKKPDKRQKRRSRSEEGKTKSKEEVKSFETPKKGRWKALTRSLMLTKSTRLEKRGPDERYPKYVLLKNEEDELPRIKECYPKMFGFRGNENVQPKPEFNFKKSFKNKTKPIFPLEEILKENNPHIEPESVKGQKKQITEKRSSAKRVEQNKNLFMEKIRAQRDNEPDNIKKSSQGHVFREIQGIIEDTLKLVPPNVESFHQQPNCPQNKPFNYCFSSQCCQNSCHDSYCSIRHAHQSNNISLFAQKTRPKQMCRNVNIESLCGVDRHFEAEVEQVEPEVDVQNLRFGVIPNFSPKFLILKAVQTSDFADEVEMNKGEGPASSNELKGQEEQEYAKPLETIEVPQQDLTLKSKMVQDVMVNDPEIDFYLGNLNQREDFDSDDDQKTKTKESETTEYLHYCEFNPPDNESVERMKIPTTPSPNPDRNNETPSTVDKINDENSKNLSLTKIGYKMYDDLTKLSLNREKENIEKAEVSGCGCNGNQAKKSPFNITLESNNNVVKVTVPENELNFQIVNSERADILIGITREENKSKKEEQEKKTVRRDELWHCDNQKRAIVLRQYHQDENDNAAGSQKLKVSLADSKEVLLSIEMKEKCEKEDTVKRKVTKDTKVGTDDFDLAGGDFICNLGESYKNLSPRTELLLKSLQEKLKIGEQERKFLEEKISEKITDQKYENKVLPGLFLVKQISPRPQLYKKPPEIPSHKKLKIEKEKDHPVGQVREYYCEDCLATMRIFEDANPSVKSMVNKFETIIQLES